jgi:phosphomevalonate kinase
LIFRAPGKVVLWGEYAVLDGAPAAVMAVNRYAEVALQACEDHWQFHSKGFLTPGLYTQRATFNQTPAAAMAETILAHWQINEYPTRFDLCSDSTAFFNDHGHKLGVGSSAAICAATYLALAELLSKPTSMAEAIAIHKSFQGNKGSGLDIACSWQGGVIRFQEGASVAMRWPAEVHWKVIWTGAIAETRDALNSFSDWRANADVSTLNALSQISTELCDGEFNLPALADYTVALRGLDEAAQLNIFTPQHERLATIASAHGLVYKPCGAGGGDIGLACGYDAVALDAFQTAAAAEHFVPLDLEIAPHGVKASA